MEGDDPERAKWVPPDDPLPNEDATVTSELVVAARVPPPPPPPPAAAVVVVVVVTSTGFLERFRPRCT